ncbi:cathepsin L-like proteinase precursor [Planoprotostelium fungivorum]|uniref:Cathepsin L-like proteinase n=1 Tax=Planoprotostelium fungivorum TaxID=1890364 RepID=A0A2P6MUC8_9EUKA|nr:cathepsin L-like proteinase precursor [Planoprotostelium fungivorum]
MVGWEEALNQFADETKEEFLAHLGLLPGPPPNNTDAIPASVYYAGARAKRGNIDWRAAGKVGSVKDQGRCGSCWAFSATAVETCVAIRTGSVPDLSEQIFQDCLETNHCSPGSGWPSSALGLAKAYDYPYLTADGICHSTSQKAWVGQKISGRGESDLENMLQGGVSVCLLADALQFYSRGVIDAPSTNRNNHAVTVVALTTNCDNRSSHCWVVKNSWGPGWGENGYFRVVKGKNAMGISTVLDSAVQCSSNSAKNDGLHGPIEYTDRPGGDVGMTKAANAQDCQTACAKWDGCDVWAFDTCGNSCWFKKAGTASSPRDCRASGIINHQLKIFSSSIDPVYLVMCKLWGLRVPLVGQPPVSQPSQSLYPYDDNFSTMDLFGKWRTDVNSFPNTASVTLKYDFDYESPVQTYSVWKAGVSLQTRLDPVDLATSGRKLYFVLRTGVAKVKDVFWSEMYTVDLSPSDVDCKYKAKAISATTNTITITSTGSGCNATPLRIDLQDESFGENQFFSDSIVTTNVKEGDNTFKLNDIVKASDQKIVVTFSVENPNYKGTVRPTSIF